MPKEIVESTRDGHTYRYENEGITLDSNNPIDPISPVNELISKDYVKKLITSDMVSVIAEEGKIPILPIGAEKLDNSWLGINLNSSYTIDATDSIKGVVQLASISDAITGTNNTKVMTPEGVKESILHTVATTTNTGVVKLTNTISGLTAEQASTLAVTPKAIKDYFNGNFPIASYEIAGIARISKNTSDLISFEDNENAPISVVSETAQYRDTIVNPLELYHYISNKDMHFNINKQGIGGIIFRSHENTSTPVTVTEKGRVYVNNSNGSLNIKVVENKPIYIGQYKTVTSGKKTTLTGSGTKVITLLDSSGNTTFPGTVTVNDFIYKSTTTTVGSNSEPVYISNGKITKCTAINNVNNATNATTATKLSNTTNIGGTAKPVYFTNGGVPAAISAIVGSTDTPVYLNNGTITTTGKSFSNYLPLAGGTITGSIYKNDSSITNGKVNVLWGQVGSNDQWAIRTGATSSDSGYLELATGDNGSEPIYVRQYAANLNNLTTAPSRTATILDESGNTTFPGSVTASSFVGNVTGTSKNVTGTVAIANGGTGATTRLEAAKALTNQNVGAEATHFVTLTTSWGKFGYSTVANVKSVLGLGNYLPLSGGTITGSVHLKNSSVTRGTTPSSTVYMTYGFKDSAGKYIGVFESSYSTDKSSKVALYAYNTTKASGNSIGNMGIGCGPDGKVYTWAPTPDNGDSSAKIATTEWVNKYISTASSAISKAANGYCTLPQGAVLQWGTTKEMAHMNTTLQVNFPKAFTTVYNISCTLYGNNVGSQSFSSGVNLEGAGGNHDKWYHLCVVYYDTNRFYVNLGDFAGTKYKVMWIAIGV